LRLIEEKIDSAGLLLLALVNDDTATGGTPNKNPQGFTGSTWSKITFTMAVSGIERNIPGKPHKAPPAKTTTIETKAFIFTFDATTFGQCNERQKIE